MEKGKDVIKSVDELSAARKAKIDGLPDILPENRKTVYYVSGAGNDNNDGRSGETAWKSCKKVSEAALCPGDVVLFRRGDVFRGGITAQSGVFYGAYGRGTKPAVYGGAQNLSAPGLWELYDKANNIWRLKTKIPDCGTLVFGGGEKHAYKHIPSYINGRFVCRDDETRPFDISRELKDDLDIVWLFDDVLTDAVPNGQGVSVGRGFPVPLIQDKSDGTLYLRCDAGEPSAVFSDIEAVTRTRLFLVKTDGVTINNLCLKYGSFGVSAPGDDIKGLTVTGCEIAWIGGNVQHYYGTDPNWRQVKRGYVTRYGNGVEIYGGCTDYTVKNCFIYEIYDAAVTVQITADQKTYRMSRVRFCDNLIENCVYSCEIFIDEKDECGVSEINDCLLSGNIMRNAGGWGMQRLNRETPAHVKCWDHKNRATGFLIENNIFDRSAARLVHACAEKAEYLPVLRGNTYIQKADGGFVRYGVSNAPEDETPPEKRIRAIDPTAKVFITE